jgi:hypothetical protein
MLDVGKTQVDEDFLLADSIPVASGLYDTHGIRLFARSSDHRALVGRFRGGWERFYGGTRWSMEPAISLSPSPQVSLELAQEWNWVNAPNGELVFNITSFRFGYSFSTKLFTNTLLQYNSLDNTFSANLRLNFIHRPGSDLFIVLTERRGVDDRLWDLANRGLVAKLTYLVRL